MSIQRLPKPSATSARINTLAEAYKAENYLEIGVKGGGTFFNVSMPHKVAVDPRFSFDPKDYEGPGNHFFPVTSDDFFATLAARTGDEPPLTSADSDGKPAFDIIFIDGLHTFEQSFRDFENSLVYSHENTIWLLDDTVPCDPYSAIPDMKISQARRKQAGLHGTPWHGDVFKTILAIHDLHPEFSYCTVMDKGNPQTVLWRAAHENRKAFFSSLEDIRDFSYFDLLDHAALLLPVNEDMLRYMIGLALDPLSYDEPNQWKSLVYRKIKTQEQVNLAEQLKKHSLKV